MAGVFFDSAATEDERRERIYRGGIFVFSPRASTVAFTEFARGLVEEAFAPLDPVQAQYELPVEKFVEIVAPLQPSTFVPLATSWPTAIVALARVKSVASQPTATAVPLVTLAMLAVTLVT